MSLKKWFLGFLGVSNLAVLTLVFGVYFNNNYRTSNMYSTIGTSDSVLENKINTLCGTELTKVLEGDRSKYICDITVKGSESNSSYI